MRSSLFTLISISLLSTFVTPLCQASIQHCDLFLDHPVLAKVFYEKWKKEPSERVIANLKTQSSWNTSDPANGFTDPREAEKRIQETGKLDEFRFLVSMIRTQVGTLDFHLETLTSHIEATRQKLGYTNTFISASLVEKEKLSTFTNSSLGVILKIKGAEVVSTSPHDRHKYKIKREWGFTNETYRPMNQYGPIGDDLNRNDEFSSALLENFDLITPTELMSQTWKTSTISFDTNSFSNFIITPSNEVTLYQNEAIPEVTGLIYIYPDEPGETAEKLREFARKMNLPLVTLKKFP